MDYRSREEKSSYKANLWFERDIFKNMIGEKDEDADLDFLIQNYKNKGGIVLGKEGADKADNSKNNKMGKPKAVVKNSGYNSDTSEDTDVSESDYDVEEEITKTNKSETKKNGFEIVKDSKGTLMFLVYVSFHLITP